MQNQASLQETKQHGAVRFPFNLYPCTICLKYVKIGVEKPQNNSLYPYFQNEAELRPFEIPCFFSYNPESLALHVQSIGVSALAVDCFFIRFLHR